MLHGSKGTTSSLQACRASHIIVARLDTSYTITRVQNVYKRKQVKERKAKERTTAIHRGRQNGGCLPDVRDLGYLKSSLAKYF
jgi:hypothetical protein